MNIDEIRRAVDDLLKGKRVFTGKNTHVKRHGSEGFVYHEQDGELTMIKQPLRKLVGYIFNHGKRGGKFKCHP